MIKTLTKNEMINVLLADEYADWTYDEADALLDFYEELVDQQGEEIEFDHIAIRCDWTSATEEEAREMYSIEGDVRDYLSDHGYCMEVEEGSFLFLNF